MRVLLRSTTLILLLAAGCVRYVPRDVDVAREADSLPLAPGGPLSYESAARLLVTRHPELRAARARILAVNLEPGPNPLTFRAAQIDSVASATTLEGDVLSLLGIGPRGEEMALARAIRDQRVLAYHERARDLAAELAEAYAVESVLRELSAPAPDFDIVAFDTAGLASTATVEAARAALEEADAEGEVIAAELADARRRIAELIAAAPTAEIDPVSVSATWPPLPEANPRALLFSRGDLQRTFKDFAIADQQFKLAVARQIPGLELRLGQVVDLNVPTSLIRVTLPIGAPAEARAALVARRAAFEDLRGDVLAALHDAESRRLLLDAAAANVKAARARAQAARMLLVGELARVETDAGAIATAVLVLGEQVTAERALRASAVEAARARVRAARAAGWPTADILKASKGEDS